MARNVYAVWEITLKCNLACKHCGSRAGKARNNELTTREALDLVHQMAKAGVTEVSLIGGEAYLRKDWLDIANEITQCGMTCSVTTGGYGITDTIAKRMKKVGISQVSVSVDGLEQSHNFQRGKTDSWKFCFETMKYLKNSDISYGANTQINRMTAKELPELYDLLRNAGCIAWQVQLTVPMGNAVDNHKIFLLQPYELLDLYPMLFYLSKRGWSEGLVMQPGNDIGYFGPYEHTFRGWGDPESNRVWMGCQAGIRSIGIEADGTIKGCPSLTTNPYAGGNIRNHSLLEIVENSEQLNFNMNAFNKRGVEHLWGFCKSCMYAPVCRGGCTWTTQLLFDRRGNNPYCHHRALTYASRGLREEVTLVENAPGLPFDKGKFNLQILPLQQSQSIFKENQFSLEQVIWPNSWLEDDPNLVDELKAEKQRSIAQYAEKAA